MAGADGPPTADPFGTSGLRAAVVGAWRSSPTRFREDANTEEDLVRGGYRDRLVVELAQNAADAAASAGVAGRLLLRLRGDVLEVSNTGDPLGADGAVSLSALRASAKRDDARSVGRFGVGFAAVLAVSDEPAVRSVGGGVAFSAAQTREVVRAEAPLIAELDRRTGQVPVLRLPFPEDAAPEPGFATTVVLPLRGPEAVALVRRLLNEVDDALLLALPSLAEVVVEAGAHHRRVLASDRRGVDVVVHDDERANRWHVVTASGSLPPELLADRPVEERERPGWSVTWAVPQHDDGRPAALPPTVPGVLHAPTPTDEVLELPALLLASFPLDPTRRQVATGALTDFLVARAAEGYVAVAAALADSAGPSALALVPGPAPAGVLDGRLRAEVLAALRACPLLRAGEPAGRRMVAAEAVVLDPPHAEVIEALAPVFDGMVHPAWSQHRQALDALGVPRLPLADALDALADLSREPAWWRGLYAALLAVEPALLEGLPVPLVDGRTVRGPRATVLPGTEVPPEDLAALGHRVVHPDAVHPLLERLGAAPAEPSRLLGDPALLARLPDADDELVEAVLRTVAASGLEPGELPGLALLPLRVAGGGRAPAGDTVLPGSPLAAVCDPAVGLVDDDVVRVHGSAALVAVGALDRLRTRLLHDIEVDPDALDGVMPGAAGWAEDVLDTVADAGGDVELPPLAAEVTAVVGLDRVADDAWHRAHALLAEPEVRRALVEPVVVRPVTGPSTTVLSPGAWWLREVPLFGGVAPIRTHRRDADPALAALYPVAAESAALDDRLLDAVGVRGRVEDLLAEPEGAAELLERLADPAADVAAEHVLALYAAAAALPESRWPEPPTAVRLPSGAGSTVVVARDVVVAVAPHHLAVAGPAALPGTTRLAGLLDLPSTEGLSTPAPRGGTEVVVPEAVREVLGGAPATYLEHDELVVDGHPVTWWVTAAGVVHASTGHGLARGLAWAAGDWPRRWEVAAVIADADGLAEVRAERAFD